MEKLEPINRIKSEAFNQFKKFGFRSVTMDNIAQELGISKKTIYNYFADKDALVDAIMLDELTNNECQCVLDVEKSSNAIHEMFMALNMMRKTMANMNVGFLFELKKYHYNSYLKFEKFKNEFLFGVIKSNLIRGIEEEYYRNDINPDIITIMRLENISMVFSNEFFNNSKYDLIYIEEQLLEHFLYGIATVKGLKLINKYKTKLHE
jgi:TetR/AcrR family transcriptional regulator, cholesterol catabolism regulator